MLSFHFQSSLTDNTIAIHTGNTVRSLDCTCTLIIKTFHYGLNTTSNQELRMLASSQSDDAIYTRTVRNAQDELDSSEQGQWVAPRSNSMHAMTTPMHVEFSEDDDHQYEENIADDDAISEETGAARIRDLPTRKTKTKDCAVANTKRTKIAGSKATTATGVRSRRKLREPTPEVDVEAE